MSKNLESFMRDVISYIRDAKDAKKKILSLKHPLGELGVLGGYIFLLFKYRHKEKVLIFYFSNKSWKSH